MPTPRRLEHQDFSRLTKPRRRRAARPSPPATHARRTDAALGVTVLEAHDGEHIGPRPADLPCSDELAWAAALDRIRDLGRGFVWLHLDGPDDGQIRLAAQTFDLHPLAVEHVLRGRPRPKVEWYDDHLMVFLRTMTHVDGEPDPADGQLAIFLGVDFIVTCGRGRHHAADAVRSRARDGPVPEPPDVLLAITDLVVRDYLELAGLMRTEADAIEEQVFARSSSGDIEQIYLLKREALRLRRSIEPLTHGLRLFAEEHDDRISLELRRSMRKVMALITGLMYRTFRRKGWL